MDCLLSFIGYRAKSGTRTAVINPKGTPAHHHAAHQHVVTAFLHCASSFGKFPEILITIDINVNTICEI
jgi:hypothetical protein